MKSRRKYDRAFKIAAVKLVTDKGTPVAEVARRSYCQMLCTARRRSSPCRQQI